jgi:ASC-1-like (ASCH) protein
MPNYHLVVVKRPYLEAILQGQKTIESRFTRSKRHFFGRVLPDDKLFLKLSSGPVCATATVAAAKHFENLTGRRILEIKQQYNDHIKGTDEYWRSKMGCGFGLLVWLKDVEPVEPVRISKKDWRAWVVLTPREDFGLLKASVTEKPKK